MGSCLSWATACELALRGYITGLSADIYRYVSADASKIELQALGQRTLDRLLEWHATLPEELVIDMATLDKARVLPHVLVLQ